MPPTVNTPAIGSTAAVGTADRIPTQCGHRSVARAGLSNNIPDDPRPPRISEADQQTTRQTCNGKAFLTRL